MMNKLLITQDDFLDLVTIFHLTMNELLFRGKVDLFLQLQVLGLSTDTELSLNSDFNFEQGSISYFKNHRLEW